ncbi:MAG: hypothetical protein LBS42_06735 [Tannerella sp.]|jgi:hypothetical protein|nr:hypothetical protein [Tannerella sp.]
MKSLKQIARNRAIIAWLFLAVFTLPNMMKPVHVHCHSDSDAEHARSSRHCDDCPICHFTLSFFMEAEMQAAGFIPPFPVREQFVYPERILFSTISPRHPRGPPEA